MRTYRPAREYLIPGTIKSESTRVVDMTVHAWWVVDETERLLTWTRMVADHHLHTVIGRIGEAKRHMIFYGRVNIRSSFLPKDYPGGFLSPEESERRIARLERIRDWRRKRADAAAAALARHIHAHGSIIDNGAWRFEHPRMNMGDCE